MTFATRNEIEYLCALDRGSSIARTLIEELGERLEALCRYDQCVCETDWRPSAHRTHYPYRDRSRKGFLVTV